MPRQDAQGRWISDDGLSYWDGTAWRPLGGQPGAWPPPPAGGRSPWPAILIGCGITLLVVLVLGIAGLFAVISNPDFQRSVCNSLANSNPNQVCPFHPSSP
ncbi:MAG: hypothetical protein M3082_19810 [Candidatus Dormibacteraeota bacterium]|nr:hypothetical protein [Candidatus Dormibacteraeota bacterium]